MCLKSFRTSHFDSRSKISKSPIESLTNQLIDHNKDSNERLGNAMNEQRQVPASGFSMSTSGVHGPALTYPRFSISNTNPPSPMTGPSARRSSNPYEISKELFSIMWLNTTDFVSSKWVSKYLFRHCWYRNVF